MPAADVASSAWYCAAGTSTPDGAATETVVVASLARTDLQVTVTVMPGGDAAPAHDTMRLAPGEEVSVPVADVLATAEPGVIVETVGGPAAVSHVLEHGGDIAEEACTRTASDDWYFAAGTTVEGSNDDLVLFNPFGDDAIVDVSFVTDTGAQEPAALQALVVPRRSRITIPVQDSVFRQARVAAHVHARSGRIVAEQTQTFDAVAVEGVTRTGIALSAGAPAPSTVLADPGRLDARRWSGPGRAGELLRRRRPGRREGGVGRRPGPAGADRPRPRAGGRGRRRHPPRPGRHRPLGHRDRPRVPPTAVVSPSSPSCSAPGRRRRRAPGSRARSAPPSRRPAGWCRCPTSTPTAPSPCSTPVPTR